MVCLIHGRAFGAFRPLPCAEFHPGFDFQDPGKSRSTSKTNISDSSFRVPARITPRTWFSRSWEKRPKQSPQKEITRTRFSGSRPKVKEYQTLFYRILRRVGLSATNFRLWQYHVAQRITWAKIALLRRCRQHLEPQEILYSAALGFWGPPSFCTRQVSICIFSWVFWDKIVILRETFSFLTYFGVCGG